jgi:hypothetical protein
MDDYIKLKGDLFFKKHKKEFAKQAKMYDKYIVLLAIFLNDRIILKQFLTK